jgi:hypothetical protein
LSSLGTKISDFEGAVLSVKQEYGDVLTSFSNLVNSYEDTYGKLYNAYFNYITEYGIDKFLLVKPIVTAEERKIVTRELDDKGEVKEDTITKIIPVINFVCSTLDEGILSNN